MKIYLLDSPLQAYMFKYGSTHGVYSVDGSTLKDLQADCCGYKQEVLQLYFNISYENYVHRHGNHPTPPLPAPPSTHKKIWSYMMSPSTQKKKKMFCKKVSTIKFLLN